jgi:hypothetical protein
MGRNDPAEVARLHAEAAQDYANGAGTDQFTRAKKETWRVGNILAAQRAANRMFSPPQGSGGDQASENPHAKIQWSDET